MADLNQHKMVSKIMSVIFFLIILTFMPALSFADQNKEVEFTGQTRTMNADDLEKSIDKVMNHRDFTWRMPKEEIKNDNLQDGFLYQSLKWVVSGIKTAYEVLDSWLTSFSRWLETLFPKNYKPVDFLEPKSRINPKYLATGLIALVIILLFIVILHIRKLRLKKEIELPDKSETIPDIADESVLADRLSSGKWFDIAFDLMEKKELRLAIRALYLGILACLADKNFIIIARHKSNREYRVELSRKAHTKKEMVADFDSIVKTIDQVWYGMHHIDRNGFDKFAATRKRILDLAE